MSIIHTVTLTHRRRMQLLAETATDDLVRHIAERRVHELDDVLQVERLRMRRERPA